MGSTRHGRVTERVIQDDSRGHIGLECCPSQRKKAVWKRFGLWVSCGPWLVNTWRGWLAAHPPHTSHSPESPLVHRGLTSARKARTVTWVMVFIRGLLVFRLLKRTRRREPHLCPRPRDHPSLMPTPDPKRKPSTPGGGKSSAKKNDANVLPFDAKGLQLVVT